MMIIDDSPQDDHTPMGSKSEHANQFNLSDTLISRPFLTSCSDKQFSTDQSSSNKLMSRTVVTY